MRVILDFAGPCPAFGPQGSDDRQQQVFSAPQQVIRADRPEEVPAALAALAAARADGKWLAGWFAYELGYALEAKLAPRLGPGQPLLVFGVYGEPSQDAAAPVLRAYGGPLWPEWDMAAYARAFGRVKDYIAAGDIYQANLSFRAGFAFAGDPFALYARLLAASAAPYAAFLEDRDRQILSLSPELFFDLTAAGVLTARPMKGTIGRDADAAALSASVKDRAENLMIVDLIRNDLGRVAAVGSVAASDLFRIETYPTLHTMVSTVTAQLKPHATIRDIVAALFPCGSVTGAPKIRAMEILQDLESSPRGAYCGAIGCFAPDGSARFNVAIRTLTISGDRGALGIGGGVVQDSTAEGEYAECLLKARFYESGRRPLELIETLKFDNSFVRLEAHLARMAHSASVFGLAFDAQAAGAALQGAVAGQAGVLRVRLTLDEAGRFQAHATPLPPNPAHWTYRVSPERMQSRDLLLRHKTSWREFYDREGERYGSDEVLFLNEPGELTEGTRSNIFVARGDKLLTPARDCGLLPGCLRAELLARGACEEAVLTEADLAIGALYLGNSLRGLIPAILL